VSFWLLGSDSDRLAVVEDVWTELFADRFESSGG